VELDLHCPICLHGMCRDFTVLILILSSHTHFWFFKRPLALRLVKHSSAYLKFVVLHVVFWEENHTRYSKGKDAQFSVTYMRQRTSIFLNALSFAKFVQM